MKHFLSTSFIVLALLAAAGVAPAAHAQNVTCTIGGIDCGIGYTCQSDGQGGTSCVLTQAGANNANSSAAAGNTGTAAAPTDAGAGATGHWYDNVTNPFNAVMWLIAEMFAWLLGVAALTLNGAVYYTVMHVGGPIQGGLNGINAIGVAWRVLRDVGNIVLIFGFLTIGLMIILNVESYGATKLLPKLLIAAVFLNFSLFISEAVVDVTNLFATQFYTAINGGVPASAPAIVGAGSNVTTPGTPSTISNEGISTAIMNQIGLQTVYGDAQTNTGLFAGSHPFLIGLLTAILCLVAAFVFFTLAFILIARFVALIFLIVVAPVGFAGYAIPKLNKLASDWWSTLISQAITAPVLLLLLYVAIAVITDTNFLKSSGAGTQPGSWTAWANAPTAATISAFGSEFLSFTIAMGLLLAVVVIAKRMGAFGADWAMKTGGKLSFGVAGWAANRTVGRGAYYASRGLRQNKTFNKINAATGRIMTRTLDRTATGSFDLRGTGALKNLPGGGIDAGTAAKDGFKGARERSIKDHMEETKRIEAAYKDKGSQRFEAQVVADREAALTRTQQAQSEAQDARDRAKKAVEELNATPETTPEALERLAEAEKTLAAAESDLTNANKNFDAAQAEMKKGVDKAAGDKMKKEIKEGKEAYAEGISAWYGQPVGLFAYGPSTGAAARKIKESLNEKPKRERLADLAKEVEKEEEEEKNKNEGGAEATKPKDGEKSGSKSADAH